MYIVVFSKVTDLVSWSQCILHYADSYKLHNWRYKVFYVQLILDGNFLGIIRPLLEWTFFKWLEWNCWMIKKFVACRKPRACNLPVRRTMYIHGTANFSNGSLVLLVFCGCKLFLCNNERCKMLLEENSV